MLVTPFERYISFLVEDNGCGFDPTRHSDGIGLKNMRERAREIGAAIVVESTPGNGTVLQFNMPFNIPEI